MEPPLPPTPQAAPVHHRGDSADYYYFVLTVALIAILLVLSNVMAYVCCSPCLLIRNFRRRFRGARTIMTWDRSRELIPVCRYKQEQSYDTECVVCLASFMDGEEVRQLPECKHSFHAPCIDMWLYSHSNCPICRASIPVLSPPERCPRSPAVREDPVPPEQLMAEPIGVVRVIVAMM